MPSARTIEPTASGRQRDDGPLASFETPSHTLIPGAAAVFGFAAVTSGQQPTGNALADIVLPFLFCAGLVWFARYASHQALVVSAVLGLFLSGFQATAAVAGIAAVAAALFVTAWRRFDSDSTASGMAIAAGFVGLTALNLPSIGFFGSASLLAAATVAPLALSALRGMPQPLRRRAIATTLGLAVAAVAATLLAAVAALGVRSHVEVGIEQAEDGVRALESGDREQARELLVASQTNLDKATGRLGGPLTWPARWVPVAAQHVRALETAADQGANLSASGARTVDQADVSRIRGSNGSVNLEVINAVHSELRSANITLINAQVALDATNSPWLVEPLGSRMDSVQERLAETGADVQLATDATAVLPGLLGADGERRYIVLFLQPAESRELGGFVGAYGLLDADQGSFSLVESGQILQDFGQGEVTVFDTPDVPLAFVQAGPDQNPQNLTATADLSTIAAAARDILPQRREDPSFDIDGVITMDPYALAGLLELTGPITIDGRDDPLDADNVVDFLLRDQYFEFQDAGRAARQDALRVLSREAFAQLLTMETPGLEQISDVFGPLARSNRLSFVTFDDAENQFFEAARLSADVPEVGSAVEMLGIYGQTAVASKLDGYARRESTYDVTVNPETGEVSGLLSIVEYNDAPADAPTFVLGNPDPSRGLAAGSNQLAFGLYTRADVTELSASTTHELLDLTDAFSYQRHSILVEVPLGESTTITMKTSSQVEPGRYDLFIPAQATANTAEFTLIVRAPAGWVIRDPEAGNPEVWRETFDLDEDHGFIFFFEPG